MADTSDPHLRTAQYNAGSTVWLSSGQDGTLKRSKRCLHGAYLTTHQSPPLVERTAPRRLLEDEFVLQQAASEAFPPEISSSHIRMSVSKYEDEMSAASKTSVCCSCGELVPTTDLHQIDDSSHLIERLQGCLDICGRHEDVWQFCAPCNASLRRGKFLKLSAKNFINVTMCQRYPSALEGLTAIEECLIAKCHPVGTILKLRPGGRSSPVTLSPTKARF